jgi:hypothetical protein
MHANQEKLEARGRIELPIKVLQTFALPLGNRACAVAGQLHDSTLSLDELRDSSFFSRHICGTGRVSSKMTG